MKHFGERDYTLRSIFCDGRHSRLCKPRLGLIHPAAVVGVAPLLFIRDDYCHVPRGTCAMPNSGDQLSTNDLPLLRVEILFLGSFFPFLTPLKFFVEYWNVCFFQSFSRLGALCLKYTLFKV